MKKKILTAVLLLAATPLLAEELKSLRDLPRGASISGQLVGEFLSKDGKTVRRLGVPGTAVTLINNNTHKVVAETTVTKDGHYRFSRLQPGEYQICWNNKAFDKGCSRPLKLKNKPVYPGPQTITEKAIPFDRIRVIPDLPNLADLLAGLLQSTQCNNGAGNPQYLVRKRNDPSGDAAREQQIGEAYYAKIDPNNRRLTLSDWWAVNGFDPVTGRAPAEENGYKAAAVSYLNDNDLGFGRNMHCLKKKNTSNVACWVANHGLADQSPGNADLAAAQENPGATVTMEFSPIDWRRFIKGVEFRGSADFRHEFDFLDKFRPGLIVNDQLVALLLGSPTVKFYVYNRSNSEQTHGEFPRTAVADLDGCGNKFVPGLCLNCHGGDVPTQFNNNPAKTTWTTQDVLEVGAASFREFDTATFKYPGGRSTPNNVEHAMFKQLNKLVQETDPADGINDLINAWYSGSGDITQNTNHVPPSWSAAGGSMVYRNTVARGCRTCHIALDGLNWDDHAALDNYGAFLSSYLCDTGDMPHAAVTDKNFSLAQTNQLLSHFVAGASCP